MTRGTDSRVGRYIRGTCEVCAADDVLVYEAGSLLLCAEHYRLWSRMNPPKQACDNCGKVGRVWRNPVPRSNKKFLCTDCHRELDVYG